MSARRNSLAIACALLGLLTTTATPSASAKAPCCAAAPGGGLTLANVASANGLVRAVGSNGLIASARAQDLSDWHLENSGVKHDLRGVVWTGSRWIVVGDLGTILSQNTNGSWTAATGIPPVGLRGIAARPGLVVAAGNGGTVLTSPDGTTFQQATSGTQSILWGGTAVGSQLLLSGQESTVIASANGVTWTSVPTFPFPTDNAIAMRPFLWQLASAGGRVVAVGDFGAILQGTVAGGLHAVTSPTDEILRGVTFAHGRWVAVGSGGVLLYSSDSHALHWHQARSPTTVDLRGVTWTGSHWVAVGDQSTVLSSTDGRHWRINVTAMPCALLGVAYGAGRFVAVGGGGGVQISHDGRRWVPERRPTSQDLYAVTHGPGQFIAVGSHATLLTSANGSRWTRRHVPVSLNLHTVQWIGTQYLAGGDRGEVLSSTNGRTWRRVSFPGFHSVRGFATGGGAVVAEGAGTIARLAPGKAWQLEPVGLGRFQTGIAYGAGRYVIVGHNGEVLVSTDSGVSWTPEASGVEVNFDTVSWTGSEFVATGEGTAIVSSDGVNWRPLPLPTQRSLRALARNSSVVVAVGDDNTHFVLAS